MKIHLIVFTCDLDTEELISEIESASVNRQFLWVKVENNAYSNIIIAMKTSQNSGIKPMFSARLSIKNTKILPLSLHKVFWTPIPSICKSDLLIVNLLFENDRIHKDVTNFKTSAPTHPLYGRYECVVSKSFLQIVKL